MLLAGHPQTNLFENDRYCNRVTLQGSLNTVFNLDDSAHAGVININISERVQQVIALQLNTGFS
jgi:hypothetical protein